MENTNEKTVSLLNGLIEINNDRIDGYEKAANEIEDGELKSLFTNFAHDSSQFRGKLISDVFSHGGRPAEGKPAAGKVYHAWMDIKAAITAKDSTGIVSSCEFGEDAAQRAYESALKEDELSPSASILILQQKSELEDSHDRVKEYRDEKVVNSL